MSRRITFLGVVRFTDRVLVAGYSPSEADDSLIIKEVGPFIIRLLFCAANQTRKIEEGRNIPIKLPNGSMALAHYCCSTLLCAPSLTPLIRNARTTRLARDVHRCLRYLPLLTHSEQNDVLLSLDRRGIGRKVGFRFALWRRERTFAAA